MPAGTIALTNGSNAVSGTGTSFTTELKQGDFVYVTVGSAPYTLVVSSVTSNTQLTLSIAFDGPTTSGLAWNAVPASMQAAITQKILNDFAQVARGRILDFQNWQKIYSSDPSVTVTRPDRTQFTGPSWGYIATQFGNKLDRTQNLNDLADKATARSNLGVSYGVTANTVAAGDDSRLGTVNNKSGGLITGNTTINLGAFFCGYGADFGFNKTSSGAVVGSGTTRNLFARCNNNATQRWEMDCFDNGSDIQARLVAFNGNDFNAFYAGVTGCGDSKKGAFAYVSSDRALKDKIEDNDSKNAWVRISKIKTRLFEWISDGRKDRGFIAQEMQEVDERYAFTPTGADIMGLSDRAILADVVDVLKELKLLQNNYDAAINELQKRMKAVDGLDA